jgi:hypothetical protein
VLADASAPPIARLSSHANAIDRESGGIVSYSSEWAFGPIVLGALLLLPIVPGFALIAVVVAALGVVAALVALAAAIVASPYLLARAVRRHLAERRESTDGPVPIAALQPSPNH